MDELRKYFLAKLELGIVSTEKELVKINKSRRLGVPPHEIKRLHRFQIFLTSYEGFGRKVKKFSSISIMRYSSLMIDYAQFFPKLAFFNKRATGFILAVEISTGFLTVLPVKSKRMSEWEDAIQTVVEQTPLQRLKMVFSDRESSLLSRKFVKRMHDKYNISLIYLKKRSKAWKAERNIRFVKRKLTGIMKETGRKDWTNLLKGLVDHHNSQKVPGTNYRRNQVDSRNFQDFLAQKFKVPDLSLYFNSSKIPDTAFLSKAWKEKIFKFKKGARVLLRRDIEEEKHIFEKPSVRGTYSTIVYTVKQRFLKNTLNLHFVQGSNSIFFPLHAKKPSPYNFSLSAGKRKRFSSRRHILHRGNGRTSNLKSSSDQFPTGRFFYFWPLFQYLPNIPAILLFRKLLPFAMLHLKGRAIKHGSDCNFQYYPDKHGPKGLPFYNVKLINIYGAHIPKAEQVSPKANVVNVTMKADFQEMRSTHDINNPFTLSVNTMVTRLKQAQTRMQQRFQLLIVFPKLEYSPTNQTFSVHLPPQSGIYNNDENFFLALGFTESQLVRGPTGTEWGLENDSSDYHYNGEAEQARGQGTDLKVWMDFDTAEEQKAFESTASCTLTYRLNGTITNTMSISVTDPDDLVLLVQDLQDGLASLLHPLNLNRTFVNVMTWNKRLGIRFLFALHHTISLTFSMTESSQKVLQMPRREWVFGLNTKVDNTVYCLILKSTEFVEPEPFSLQNKMHRYYPFIILATDHQTNSYVTGKGSVCSLAFVDEDRVINSNRIVLSTKGGSLNLGFITPDFKDVHFATALDIYLHLKIV